MELFGETTDDADNTDPNTGILLARARGLLSLRSLVPRLESELQSVIGNTHTIRESRFSGLRKVVADVREISGLGLYESGDLQGLAHAQMCRMRSVPQRIDDQNFDARNKIDNRIRHRAAIAQISDKFLIRAREKITIHDRVAMRHRQRSDQRLAKFERPMNGVRFGFEIIWDRIACLERELKHTFQVTHRFGRRIDRHRATRVRKAPEIVETHDVVGVRMRENYRIHIADILAKCLRSEISPSVHDP